MFVYVDDTDPAIQYGGEWSSSNTTDIFDGYGAPLYRTLHGANDKATFTFSFSGTYVAVFLISNSKTPDYNCTIDGMPFSLVVTPLPVLSSSELANLSPQDLATCWGYLSNDGKSHQLDVTVSGSQSSPVFFDYLQYSPTQSITDADLAFSVGDPSIVIGPTNPDTRGLLPGSALDFTFVGYSATIRGAFDTLTFSHLSSPLSYTIDGGPPINFTISNAATNFTPLLNNQLILQTPVYPLGKHVLRVEFLGTNATVPFVPTDFVVQNQTGGGHVELTPVPSATAPLPPPSMSISISSASSPSPSPSSSGSSPTTNTEINHPGNPNSNHTVILGTALGTVTLISVLLLAIVLVRRKSRVGGEDGVYVPHDLLRETTVLPFHHETMAAAGGTRPEPRWRTRKNWRERERRVGDGDGERGGGTANVGNGNGGARNLKTVVHVDSGARVPQPQPQPRTQPQSRPVEDGEEDETRLGITEVVELPPTYETIDHDHGVR